MKKLLSHVINVDITFVTRKINFYDGYKLIPLQALRRDIRFFPVVRPSLYLTLVTNLPSPALPVDLFQPLLFNTLQVRSALGAAQRRKLSFKNVSNVVVQLLHSIKYSMEVPFSNMALQPDLKSTNARKVNHWLPLTYSGDCKSFIGMKIGG